MDDFSKFFIVSDLDGTVVTSDFVIPQKNIDAINYFIENGGRFTIATGRSVLSVIPYKDKLPLKEPCIIFNGICSYDFITNKFIDVNYLEIERFKEFIYLCKEKFSSLVLEVLTEYDMFIVSDSEENDHFLIEESIPFKRVDVETAFDNKVIKLMFYSKNRNELELAEKLFLENNLDKYSNTVYSHENYLEFLPPGMSKGVALKNLRKKYKDENRIFVAVGDYFNDIEMIKESDFGIAMQDAPMELKNISDFVTTKTKDGALHDVIYNILPKIKKIL